MDNHSYALDQRIKRHLYVGQLPDELVKEVSKLGIHVPIDAVTNINRYIRHLQNRESIRVGKDAIDSRILKYSKKKSRRSQMIAKTLEGIKTKLIQNEMGDWHRPYVSPFHTKTGRDCTLGTSLNQIPKEYWHRLLSPPKGSVYVLLDYSQQEPVIAAKLAECKKLLDWYEKGDIYEQLARAVTHDNLSREQSKILLVGRLYGIGIVKLAKKLNASSAQVRGWLNQLKNVIHPIEPYLDELAIKIKEQGVACSLDWRYAISDMDSALSLRNWQVQATGADIMRRSCHNLDKAKIPLLLTNHDSFLVRLDEVKRNEQLELAIQALTDASATVLNDFKLKVKVEMQLLSST